MDWPQAGLEGGAQALEIDYDAAGLSPLPDQMDLDGLLRSLLPIQKKDCRQRLVLGRRRNVLLYREVTEERSTSGPPISRGWRLP